MDEWCWHDREHGAKHIRRAVGRGDLIMSTENDISPFISSIEEASVREDSEELIRLLRETTGESPELWGDRTVGFGSYHYRYASGREGDQFKVGFAPRPRRLTIYVMSGFVGYEDLLSKLGRYERGKSCLYIRRLSDVDPEVLRALVARCVRHIDQVEADQGAITRMSTMPPPSV